MPTAEAIAARARAAGPRCGAVTVVAIDGPAGSGKTTLAAAVAPACDAQVLHMDDLYPGWGGLRAGGGEVGRLLRGLAQGEEVAYRRFDWEAMDHREEHSLSPRGTIVVEGVGSVRREHLELLSLIVLVAEPDSSERLQRGLARDGAGARLQWEQWMREESLLHEEVGLADLADVVVDGRGRIVKG